MTTQQEEKEIRTVIEKWMKATSEEDIPAILPLMSEEVIFLRAGKPPMKGRNSFEKNTKEAMKKFSMLSKSDIQEIQVAGDYAFCWSTLTVTMIPKNKLFFFLKKEHTGNVLSVFRKESNRWVLLRDANLLS